MASTEDAEYRRKMEEFVSNHGGSSPQEIILTLLPNICTIFLTSTIIGLFNGDINRNLLLIIEFILNIIPCVLSCTLLTNNTLVLSTTILTISLINFLIILNKKLKNQTKIRFAHSKRRNFITNFRALVNIITSICILAVDFNIFPRKLAKTEIYGYSLMDTGVGLFIISNALVAPETKEENQSKNNMKLPLIKRFNINARSCIKSTLPLLLLGFGRCLAVEYSGYQKHVTEYGVHWNFFITLAFVKIFSSTVASAITSRYSLLSGFWILMMHEYALSTKDLKQWVFGNTPRSDFVSANREGIISVPGYVGLYFIGISIGRLINSTYRMLGSTKEKHDGYLELNKSLKLCVKFSIIASIFCILTLVAENYFGVSRRLANIGYCLWILTLTVTLLTLLILVEVMIDMMNSILNRNSSKLLGSLEVFEAVNYNGLVYFLLSNLMTGLINMNIKTLYVDSIDAIKILIFYMTTNIFLTVILYRFKIKIKL